VPDDFRPALNTPLTQWPATPPGPHVCFQSCGGVGTSMDVLASSSPVASQSGKGEELGIERRWLAECRRRVRKRRCAHEVQRLHAGSFRGRNGRDRKRDHSEARPRADAASLPAAERCYSRLQDNELHHQREPKLALDGRSLQPAPLSLAAAKRWLQCATRARLVSASASRLSTRCCRRATAASRVCIAARVASLLRVRLSVPRLSWLRRLCVYAGVATAGARRDGN